MVRVQRNPPGYGAAELDRTGARRTGRQCTNRRTPGRRQRYRLPGRDRHGWILRISRVPVELVGVVEMRPDLLLDLDAAVHDVPDELLRGHQERHLAGPRVLDCPAGRGTRRAAVVLLLRHGLRVRVFALLHRHHRYRLLPAKARPVQPVSGLLAGHHIPAVHDRQREDAVAAGQHHAALHSPHGHVPHGRGTKDKCAQGDRAQRLPFDPRCPAVRRSAVELGLLRSHGQYCYGRGDSGRPRCDGRGHGRDGGVHVPLAWRREPCRHLSAGLRGNAARDVRQGRGDGLLPQRRRSCRDDRLHADVPRRDPSAGVYRTH